MNPLNYYERRKEPWNEEEKQQVRREYVNDLLNIQQLGDLHKRTPGSIAYALKSLKLVNDCTQLRGYAEYRASDLYKEVCREEPARTGKPWKEDEVTQLLASLQAKKSFEEIAKEHERTVGSIHSYRTKIAVDYLENGRPIELIETLTCLTKKQIEDAAIKRGMKRLSETTPVNVTTAEDSSLRVLREEIMDMKKDIKLILAYMTSIYEFETEQ